MTKQIKLLGEVWHSIFQDYSNGTVLQSQDVYFSMEEQNVYSFIKLYIIPNLCFFKKLKKKVTFLFGKGIFLFCF